MKNYKIHDELLTTATPFKTYEDLKRDCLFIFLLLIIPVLTHADPQYDDSCLYQLSLKI